MVRGPLPALLLLLLCVRGEAQSAPSSEAVNAAIERGVDFLLRSQNRDGSWGLDLHERGLAWHDLRDGATALGAYTLMKCGFAPDHPALQRALAFLLESKPRHTYATGIQLHILGALGDPSLKKRMQELLGILLDLKESGGWDYPGLGRADLSNTQVAALGFRAAHAAGLSLPKGLWPDLVEIALRYQERPTDIPGTELLPKEARRMAGFAYEPGGAASASMTTAGLTILGIACEDPTRVDHRLDGKIAEARALALNWLAQHYSVEGNPQGEGAWHYYYLYGLERVGALFGLQEIGTHDWYAEGAAQLIKEQRPPGGWWQDGRTSWPPSPMPIANTSFALLFLRKATLSKPSGARTRFFQMEDADSQVWVRVDARATWTVWLSGFAPATLARFPSVSTPDGPRPGLFVESVEWWLAGERLVSLPGDAREPWKDARFATQVRPTRGGEFELECRVRLAQGAVRELRSRPLRVTSEALLEPWMLEYARDAAHNLLRAEDFVLTASSEESGFHPKGDVLDGMQGSSWWAKEDDPEPWIRLESAKGVRLKELWLSPAGASEVWREQCLAFEQVELRVNDAKAAFTITMDPDERLKTRFVLPKPMLVRKLELRVLAPPPVPGKFVGFAELEGR